MGIFKVILIFPVFGIQRNKIFPKMFMAEIGLILTWSHRLHSSDSLLFRLRPCDKVLVNVSDQKDILL